MLMGGPIARLGDALVDQQHDRGQKGFRPTSARPSGSFWKPVSQLLILAKGKSFDFVARLFAKPLKRASRTPAGAPGSISDHRDNEPSQAGAVLHQQIDIVPGTIDGFLPSVSRFGRRRGLQLDQVLDHRSNQATQLGAFRLPQRFDLLRDVWPVKFGLIDQFTGSTAAQQIRLMLGPKQNIRGVVTLGSGHIFPLASPSMSRSCIVSRQPSSTHLRVARSFSAAYIAGSSRLTLPEIFPAIARMTSGRLPAAQHP